MTTTTSLSREEVFTSFKQLSYQTQQMLRRGASDALVQAGAEEVGTSDVSNQLYSDVKAAGGDWYEVLINYVHAI